MCDFAGTCAERGWSVTLKRIASALERIADQLEATCLESSGEKEAI